MDKIPVIAIVGPTGVGKTDLSIRLAKKLNGEIISCDSMQIYREMDIGTAQPTKEEMMGIPHHMIDIVNPDESYNVDKYVDNSSECIKDVFSRGNTPILAGGTGLYADSLLGGISFVKTEGDEEYRNYLFDLAEKEGNEYVHKMLETIDPVSFKAIHPNNVRRVVRALEVYKCTGNTITYHNEMSKKEPSPYNPLIFGLTRHRDELYERIDKRVDIMVEKGLVKEAENLYNKGYTTDLTSMQGLGYKEFIKYFEGEMSLSEAIEILKRDTRHYAKRQLTWFNRNKDIVWINLSEMTDDEAFNFALEKSLEHLNNDY